MANEVCFRTLHLDQPWSLEAYESVGGYSALKRIAAGELCFDKIIDELKLSALRGRGGAGRPFRPRVRRCHAAGRMRQPPPLA